MSTEGRIDQDISSLTGKPKVAFGSLGFLAKSQMKNFAEERVYS